MMNTVLFPMDCHIKPDNKNVDTQIVAELQWKTEFCSCCLKVEYYIGNSVRPAIGFRSHLCQIAIMSP